MRRSWILHLVMIAGLIVVGAGVSAALIGAAFEIWTLAIAGLIALIIGFAVAIGAIMLDE